MRVTRGMIIMLASLKRSLEMRSLRRGVTIFKIIVSFIKIRNLIKMKK